MIIDCMTFRELQIVDADPLKINLLFLVSEQEDTH